MRVFVVGAVALAVLAGCDGIGRPSDKQALTASCIEGGEIESTCNCITETLETKLPPELYKKVAKAAGHEKQDMQEYLLSLPVEDMMAFSAVVSDIEACGNAAPAPG